MLTERNRAVLYRRLTDLVGDEEAIGEMLSNFPSDDRDPLVTESRLDAGLAGLRAEMHAQTTHLIMWMVGIAVSMGAVIVAAIGILA